jgi:hypothetical protein
MPKVPKTPTMKAPATPIPPALQPFGQPKGDQARRQEMSPQTVPAQPVALDEVAARLSTLPEVVAGRLPARVKIQPDWQGSPLHPHRSSRPARRPARDRTARAGRHAGPLRRLAAGSRSHAAARPPRGVHESPP